MFERASLFRVLPFGIYVLFMFATDMLEQSGSMGNDLRWLYAVKVGAVAALLYALRNAYSELRFPHDVSRNGWIAAVVAGAAVFLLWITLSVDWMVIGTPTGFDPRSEAGMDWWLVSARLVGAVLVVPVMEELFWRSFLLRWIEHHDFMAVEPARVGLSALMITTVFFAFEHNLWLAGLVAGAVYNVLYIRSGNLWVSILSHAVTNALLGVWVIQTGNWLYW